MKVRQSKNCLYEIALDKIGAQCLLNEVEQVQEEKLGPENRGVHVSPLVLETKDIINASTTVWHPNVKADKDEANLKNGSSIDPLMLSMKNNDIVQNLNNHLNKITCEDEQVVENTEVYDANKIINVADVINADDWLPTASRSTHRRFLKRKVGA